MLHLIAALVVSASLMPSGKQTYTDAAGAPLAGGRVYTYAAGTSTPLATYSDKAGTVPNTNPVILDARGEATIFWAPAGYKVVLKDSADVTVWTQDDMYSPVTHGDIDVALVTATGATNPRALRDRLGETRSVADYTSGISEAVPALPSAGTTLRVPTGTYTLSSGITLGDFQRIEGQSAKGSKVNFTGTGKAIQHESAETSFSGLFNLWLHGNASAGDHCIEVRNKPLVSSSQASFLMRDTYVDNCPAGRAALHFLGIKPPGGNGNVYGANVFDAHFNSNAGDGIRLEGTGGSGSGTEIMNIWASSASGNTGHGIRVEGSDVTTPHYVNLIGNLLQGNTQPSLVLAPAKGLILGNYFEQVSPTPALKITGNPVPAGPLFFAGNSIGNQGGAAYAFDAEEWLTTYGKEGVVSFANAWSAATAGYRIDKLRGARIGPDRPSTALTPMVDWTNSWGWRMVEVHDWVNDYWGITSDTRYVDSPHVGIGVTQPNITAYLHVSGHQPYSVSGTGTDATDILRIDGSKGGNTSGTTGQTAGHGGDVVITAGNGGNAPSGSFNGSGGDVVITAGFDGAGAGTVAADGLIKMQSGVQFAPQGTKPNCSSASRGVAWITQGGAGVRDAAEVCVKDAADSYVWIPVPHVISISAYEAGATLGTGCTDYTPITATGAVASADCFATLGSNTAAELSASCFVPSTNVVTIRICNHSGSPVTQPAIWYRARVFNP